MSDKPIPERWLPTYRWMKGIYRENKGMGGHLADTYGATANAAERATKAIEELGAAEAALSKANKVIDQLKQQGCPIEAELDEARQVAQSALTRNAELGFELRTSNETIAQLQARLTQRGLDIASVCEERAQLQATISSLTEALKKASESCRKLINGVKPDRIHEFDPQSWHDLLASLHAEGSTNG